MFFSVFWCCIGEWEDEDDDDDDEDVDVGNLFLVFFFVVLGDDWRDDVCWYLF